MKENGLLGAMSGGIGRPPRGHPGQIASTAGNLGPSDTYAGGHRACDVTTGFFLCLYPFHEYVCARNCTFQSHEPEGG